MLFYVQQGQQLWTPPNIMMLYEHVTEDICLEHWHTWTRLIYNWALLLGVFYLVCWKRRLMLSCTSPFHHHQCMSKINFPVFPLVDTINALMLHDLYFKQKVWRLSTERLGDWSWVALPHPNIINSCTKLLFLYFLGWHKQWWTSMISYLRTCCLRIQWDGTYYFYTHVIVLHKRALWFLI